jgi:hypothetical protein
LVVEEFGSEQEVDIDVLELSLGYSAWIYRRVFAGVFGTPNG